MKKFLLLFIIALSYSSTWAYYYQTDPADTLWKKSGNFNLNIQQTGFSNWANGGESSVALGSVLNYTANYKDVKQSWKNNLNTAYGFVSKESQGLRKNNDLIVFTSEYGRNLNKNWQITASVDFRTQFSNGYEFKQDAITGDEVKTLVSAFMAPGYLQPFIGINYKKGDYFSVNLSPIADKMTFVTEESLSAAGAYGVEPGKKFRSQLGANINVSYQKEVMENVTVKTNLLLFGDYKELNYWDVNYDLFIDFKINNYLSTNFLLQAIYDHDIKGNSENDDITGPALQIRNVLNIGLNLKF